MEGAREGLGSESNFGDFAEIRLPSTFKRRNGTRSLKRHPPQKLQTRAHLKNLPKMAIFGHFWPQSLPAANFGASPKLAAGLAWGHFWPKNDHVIFGQKCQK